MWRHAPRGAVLRGASIHFIQPFIMVLSRNLDQICLKCVFFGKKTVRSPQRRFAPEPPMNPVLLLWPTDVALSRSFPALNYFITSKK